MRPVAVVMLGVLTDHGFEVSATEEHQPIHTFPTYGPNEALCKGVGTRCPNRSTDDPNALGAEDLVEVGRELGVSIPDQEFDRSWTLGEFIGQIPGLLDYPRASRMCRHTRHEDLSGVELDEEQDVEPLQQHGVDAEE